MTKSVISSTYSLLLSSTYSLQCSICFFAHFYWHYDFLIFRGFKKIYLFFLLPSYMCTKCAPKACKGQDMVLDPLELELQLAMCSHMGSGNQTRVLQKS